MDHHRDIDVVECAQAHHLGLAAQELELALFAKREPLFELDVLLGGHGHQRDAAGQLGRDLAQRQARAEHHRDLGVVAAGVHGARAGIAVGMLPAQQRIQLAENGDRRPGGATRQIGARAGERDAVLVAQAKSIEPRHAPGARCDAL